MQQAHVDEGRERAAIACPTRALLEFHRQPVEMNRTIEGERAIGTVRSGLCEAASARKVSGAQQVVDERVGVGLGLAQQGVGERAMELTRS